MVKNSNKAQQEEQYKDYLRFRNENDSLRIQEQGKMDKIIFTCSIGLIGIGFGFAGIVFEKQANCWFLFSLAILFACLSIIANYYSSWCSVKSVLAANSILDSNIQKGEDVHQTITTPYDNWINILNNMAMIFVILGILLFFSFVYANMVQKNNNNEDKSMTIQNNITILCEGCDRSKPTIAPKSQKTISRPNIRVQNGAERNKPTVSKSNTGNSTGKK